MLHLLCHESRLQDCLNTAQDGDAILLLDQATILAKEKLQATLLIRETDAKQLGLPTCHAKQITDEEWVKLSEEHPKNMIWKSL